MYVTVCFPAYCSIPYKHLLAITQIWNKSRFYLKIITNLAIKLTYLPWGRLTENKLLTLTEYLIKYHHSEMCAKNMTDVVRVITDFLRDFWLLWTQTVADWTILKKYF